MTPEQLCRKAEYLLEDYLRRRSAVASACVQPASSKEVLTQAQKNELAKKMAIIEAGGNPFDKYTDRTKRENESDGKALDAGGKKLDERNATPPASKAASWYRKGPEFHAVRLHVDLSKEVEVKEWPTIKTPDGRIVEDPSVRRCSLCYKFFHVDDATEGKGKAHKIDTGETDTSFFPDGSVSWVSQRLLHTQSVMTACPDCVLQLSQTALKRCSSCRGSGKTDIENISYVGGKKIVRKSESLRACPFCNGKGHIKT